jgi:hypothetical protein
MRLSRPNSGRAAFNRPGRQLGAGLNWTLSQEGNGRFGAETASGAVQ